MTSGSPSSAVVPLVRVSAPLLSVLRIAIPAAALGTLLLIFDADLHYNDEGDGELTRFPFSAPFSDNGVAVILATSSRPDDMDTRRTRALLRDRRGGAVRRAEVRVPSGQLVHRDVATLVLDDPEN